MENRPVLNLVAPKKRRIHYGKALPPPPHSACIYVQLAPRDVGMFRFLLEAEDNLGYMSVVDRWSAALKVVFSPHQEQALRAWLAGISETLRFKELPCGLENEAHPPAPGRAGRFTGQKV